MSKPVFSQGNILRLAVFVIVFICGCGRNKEDVPVIPPETSPLSRQLIGYAVVNVSYTHVNTVPLEGSASAGYLRRGSLVGVLERRSVKNPEGLESWVLVEGSSRGWLKEMMVNIYDNEGQAKTASEAMNR